MAKHRLSVLRNHVNVHDVPFYVCTMIVHRLDVSMGMGFWIDGGGIGSVCFGVDGVVALFHVKCSWNIPGTYSCSSFIWTGSSDT